MLCVGPYLGSRACNFGAGRVVGGGVGAIGTGVVEALGFVFVIFFLLADAARCSGDFLCSHGISADGVSPLSSAGSPMDTASGPVDRMKSAKSWVVSGPD